MAMKAYKSYKDTDQFWLKQIPSHWDIHKIKYVFNERSEKGHPEEPLLVSSQNMGVVPKSVYGNRTVEAMKGLDTLKLVKVGDFVISLRSFQGGIEYAYYQGIISPAYTIMILKGHVTPEYFRHLAKSDAFIKLLKLCVTGIREGQNINYTLLRNYRIPVPPKEEQDQIVRYLDWQNSRLNKLINAKKKEIALLEEQKQALISQAVTKGLDPHAPLKDSGIDWIGKIPEHWEINKMNRLFNLIGRGTTPNSGSIDFYNNGNIPWLNSGDLYGDKPVIEKTAKHITELALNSFSALKLYDAGSIAIAMYGDHSLGNVSIVPFNFCCNQACCIFSKPRKNLNSKYVYYGILAGKDSLIRQARGGGQPNINQDILRQFRLPFPPLHEQEHIVDYLTDQCAIIDDLIANINKTISLLQEYRTRLVADVVTGQIDVRHITIPNYETVTETIDQPETTEDETNNITEE